MASSMAPISQFAFLCTLGLQLMVIGIPRVVGQQPSIKLVTTVAENDLTARINTAINSQLEKGVQFSQNHLIRSNVMQPLSVKQYNFLQLFYGLSSSEEIYTKLFVKIGHLIKADDTKKIKEWLTDSFNFSSIDKTPVKRALVNFVAWDIESSGKDSGILSDIMLHLAMNYSIVDDLSGDNDVKALKWLLKFEPILKCAKAELLEENWNKGNIEVVKTILQKGGLNSEGISKFIKNMSDNKEFIRFIVRNEIFDAFVYLLSENLFDPVIIVEEIINENKLNFLNYFIQKSCKLSNNETVPLKNFLNAPIIGGEATLLYKAIEGNNSRAKDTFMKAGADVNVLLKGNKTLLHTAVSQSNVNVVRELIKHKAILNVKDSQGISPLNVAVSTNNTEILGLLLQAGSPIDTGSFDLMYESLEKNDTDTINLLLKAGANINDFHKCYRTFLHRAVLEGKTYVLNKIIELGGDIFIKDCHGMTPMHLAISTDNQNMITIFAKNHFSMNKIFDNGTSLLSFAAMNSSIETIKTLINFGSEVDLIPSNSKTALYEALVKNRTDVVQYLLNKGANINIKLPNGHTYLHSAVELGSGNFANHVIKKGIMIDELNDNGETPLAIAVQKNHHVLVHVLLRNGANTSHVTQKGDTYLHLAVRKNSVEALQALLGHGIKPDYRGLMGDTAMWLAVKKDHVHLLEILKSFESDVKQRNQWAYSLHHQAAYSDSSKAIEWLAKNDLSVNITDTLTKTTPLHLAAYSGHVKSVQMLLSLNACVNCKDATGFTPLQMAEYYHRSEAAKLIRSAGGTM